MADKRISDLNLHTALELSDSLPIINNGETKKTTYGSLYYGIRDGVVSGSHQIDVKNTENFSSFSASVDTRLDTLETAPLPNLISSGITSPGTAVVANATSVGINFSEAPDFTFNANGTMVFPDGTTQTTAYIGINTGSFASTGSNLFVGNQTITGSFLVSGSTTQNGNTTLLGNTQLYGTLDVSGSTNFRNHTITMTGSMYTSGSQTITGSLDIKGNVNVASGSEFYLAGNKLFNYGVFSDTTTQSGSANTAYSMKLNTIDFAHEVNIVSGSRITPINTGVYNLQFSAQLSNTANTNIGFDIWLDYTGSNVSNSNTQVSLSKGSGQLGKVVASWNWLMPIKANDYVEIRWSCTDSTGQIYAMGTQTNPTRPAIPSVIATLTQIG